jgi:ubiquinone/menaquinone biosynthesis C-methylase UbiE
MERSELFEMARAYQKSALVLAIAELEICNALEEFPAGATVQALAEQLGSQLRPLAALLDAAVALDLLAVKEGCYFNTATSRDYLVKGAPGSMVEQFKGYFDQYRGWANLPQAVRTGQQVLPSLHNDATGDSVLRQLLLGLHQGGRAIVPQIKPHLDSYLAKARRLLDVGSGVGTYGLAFAEAYPDLEVTLLDQKGVLEIAREITAGSPAHSRLHFFPADYHQQELGQTEYDLVLFFQVLRTESSETIRTLLHKAARALRTGGGVAIYDTWLEEDRSAPAENVFQNLTLALMYAEGGLFTAAELGGWLLEAGFKLPRHYSVTGARPMVLYLAERADS